MSPRPRSPSLLTFLLTLGFSRSLHTFGETSLLKRIITTTVLLFLVSTVIPYQFVFIVLCIVQVATCVRALCLARETVRNMR